MPAPYFIQNQQIFQAAYAGAFAGMSGESFGNGQSPSIESVSMGLREVG